jgi:hypothetical protein
MSIVAVINQELELVFGAWGQGPDLAPGAQTTSFVKEVRKPVTSQVTTCSCRTRHHPLCPDAVGWSTVATRHPMRRPFSLAVLRQAGELAGSPAAAAASSSRLS